MQKNSKDLFHNFPISRKMFDKIEISLFKKYKIDDFLQLFQIYWLNENASFFIELIR